ncbi:phasin family protein [Sediminibacillus massiliensis]|uniref:phasin family protein n=1 Tax=Sediminibacillus massiliensis TaxID=1926277 RepID=UPI00098835F3|nr:hypothetical protein [Sediminibacillus massiliensis]
MSDMLKKGFLLGLGAAISGKEKMEKMLNDLVENDQLTPQQAREMFREFISKGETKASQWSRQQNEQWDKIIDDVGLVSKKEFKELEARIRRLEEYQKSEDNQRPDWEM